MNEIVTILATTKSQKQTCLDIRYQVFVQEQKFSVEEENKDDEHSIHFLSFFQNKPAATGRIRKIFGCIKFERIATLIPYRGKKIGSHLMKTMQSYCHQFFPKYLPLTFAQINATQFYEKLGWIKVGNIFLEENIEHQKMILPPKKKEWKKLVCLKDPTCLKDIQSFLNG